MIVNRSRLPSGEPMVLTKQEDYVYVRDLSTLNLLEKA